jgi:iron complex outermembrane receptor protein
VGYRYTEEDKDYKGQLFIKLPDAPPLPDPGPPGIGLPAERGDQDWDEDTWKLGLDYQLNDDVMYYASFAQGFRSGGFNARNTQPGTAGPYDPEYVDQYEIGIKGDFLDNTLRINAAAFYTDYDDKQEDIIFPAVIGGSLTLVENAGEVEISGVEGELTWVASENLTLAANFGYLDAEYNEFTGTDGVDRSDLELRRVPEWTGGANVNYTRSLGPGTISVFLGWRYTDEYWVDLDNDPRGLLDDQSIFDANAAYEWEWSDGRMIKITVFGRDITDNQDWNSAVQIPGLISFGAVAGGEEYGLKISGNF